MDINFEQQYRSIIIDDDVVSQQNNDNINLRPESFVPQIYLYIFRFIGKTPNQSIIIYILLNIILGKQNWDNKAILRAISSEIFKVWKPAVYNNIKMDYNLIDFTDEDDDAFLKSMMEGIPDFSPHLQTDNKENVLFEPPYNYTTLGEEMKNLSDKFDNIENSIAEKNEKMIKEKIQQSFKCVVCFESRPTSFFACCFCGRFLGCFICIKRLKSCPICRKTYQCTACETALPRSAFFLPGLEEYVTIPVTPNPSSINVPSGDESSSDDSLPPAPTSHA